MTSLKNVYEAVMWFVIGIIISGVSWRFIPGLLNVLPNDEVKIVGWFALLIFWVALVFAIPYAKLTQK